METAFLRIKYWIVVSILANVVTIGVPSLFAAVSVYNTATQAAADATRANARIDARTPVLIKMQRDLSDMQEHLEERDGYKKPADGPIVN